MKTAIITGASSGLGRELARQIEDVFPDIACYWLIAGRTGWRAWRSVCRAAIPPAWPWTCATP